MEQLLVEVDGLPVLVRFLVGNVPAERCGFVSKDADIHSLLLRAIERMIGRSRESSPPSDNPSRQPAAMVELIPGPDPLVRPPAQRNETVLRVGPLALDLLDRTAKRGDRPIHLRQREFLLLKYMMQRSERLLTREILLKDVWHYKFIPKTNLLDVHMGRLRRKVDGPNEDLMIRNVRGLGFVLSATRNAAEAALLDPPPIQASKEML